MNLAHLEWPFFSDEHRALAVSLDAWATQNLKGAKEPSGREAVDAACRELVRRLGAAGWLRLCVGDDDVRLDSRSICLVREVLASHGALADFAFAMQGLGSAVVSLAGTSRQRERYLPRVADGSAIAAFALSEPGAGSDAGALECSAAPSADGYELNGEKTWISNGGIASFYVVFARLPDSRGSAGVCAFIVDADTPGLEIAERLDVISPHPLARLRFTNCRVLEEQRVGVEGEGFKLAMRALDIFRTSVGAAAVGFARRALALSMERAATRTMFGINLGALQLTQARLADIATDVDAAALLVYRAAWLRDQGSASTKREAAMAKLAATEAAQRAADGAVQLWGGAGVQAGASAERLYRDVRALRIYEGASEVQRLIIGSDLLRTMNTKEAI
ncbi:MAG TPA: acyl-CoA dehydrogenase family protein [Hyphomicrobium sp.]|mgnify:CR=1 FL=1|uniref:acyl-CoA dehydrogenase family protein n=1 Tax=Hyphomicrobium sp. TaxID=82 RepID=UPI002C121CAC|nr:acyl-CoA dehydrogenase family protein [Hyphomicrobium sp.]HRN89923.1 acyl-CoA dehydrogenase family protein [Hyphomicrobium sp.]